MIDALPGICPLCEGNGQSGTPCTNTPICSKREIQLIPGDYFEPIRVIPPNDRDPYLGLRIDDYLIVGLLGEGGFGKVFLALQMPLQMPAALKLMSKSAIESLGADALEVKFRSEALSLSKLHHPNIVRLLKYGIAKGRPYMVMEYVGRGRSLEDEIKGLSNLGRSIDLPTMRKILNQILNALGSAHAEGIVHRDIKPENIMLQRVTGDDHFVRILDFGLAKFLAEGTQTSLVMGTPVYMAPEQLSRRNIGPWTDLYALGVITFEMLTGSQPFSGASFQELASKKLDPNYDPSASLREQRFPPFVKTFFDKAIDRDTKKRFRDVESFKAGLMQMLDRLVALPSATDDTPPIDPPVRQPLALPPDEPVSHPVAPPVSRGGNWSLPILLFIVGFMAVFGVLWWLDQPSPDNRLTNPTATVVADVHSPQKPFKVAGGSDVKRPTPTPVVVKRPTPTPVVVKQPTPTLADVKQPVPQPRPLPDLSTPLTDATTMKRVVVKLVPSPIIRPPTGAPPARCRAAVGPKNHLDALKVPANPVADLKGLLDSCAKACELGDGWSCWALGRVHGLGLGRTRDSKKAQKLFKKACKLSSGVGCRYFAYAIRGIGGSAKAWTALLKACLKQDGPGCTELGLMYERPKGFPARNYPIALGKYKQGCELQHAVGCARAASMYVRGLGTVRNPIKAALFFKKACHLGHQASCQNLKKMRPFAP